MDLDALLPHMRDVVRCHESLRELNMMWRMIDSSARMNCPDEASGLLPMMAATRDSFHRLEDELVTGLVRQKVANVMGDAGMRARHTIDIIVRNLFERTADVGFLATDGVLCHHVAGLLPDRQEAGRRLLAYRDKYTVYRNILLLDTTGAVVAGLDGSAAPAFSRDPFVQQALSCSAFVEWFGPTDLCPGAGASLVYAQRMLHPRSGAPAGVLCLVFDFEAEMAGIFASRHAADGRSVIVLLDAQGRVIASADPQWIAPGARVPVHANAEPGLCIHAGRQYLVQNFRAAGYQGYPGPPGWQAQVMVPLESAFIGRPAGVLQTLPAALGTGLLGHARSFCPPLHGIIDAAESVRRVVWNGQVMTAGSGGRRRPALEAVLAQIDETGARTNTVFDDSIRSLYDTALATFSTHSRQMTHLLVELMDRNLYERSADCRWWAMTPELRQALSQPVPDAAALRQASAALERIHALYTVYARLVVYDRSGRIVAASGAGPAGSPVLGQQVDAATLQAVLALRDEQCYYVEPFGPSPLSDGQSTCIFHAAIRATGPGTGVSPNANANANATAEAVGGIGIVFDAQREFTAMLREGVGAAGASALYVGRDGIVRASTDPALPAGSRLALPDDLRGLAPGQANARILVRDGQYVVLGCAVSSGYREFKRADGHRDDVLAVLLHPLGEELARRHAQPEPLQAHATGARASPFASFTLGDGLYALPARHVLEALPGADIRPAALGSVVHRTGLVARRIGGVVSGHVWVFDLSALVTGIAAPAAHTGQVVVFSIGDLEVGLRVDQLHGVPAFDESQLVPAPPAAVGPARLVSHLVRANAGRLMVQVIDAERLAAKINRLSTGESPAVPSHDCCGSLT